MDEKADLSDVGTEELIQELFGRLAPCLFVYHDTKDNLTGCRYRATEIMCLGMVEFARHSFNRYIESCEDVNHPWRE